VPSKKKKEKKERHAMVDKYFHEHRKFEPCNFKNDWNDISLQKRGSFITPKCSKFCGAYKHVRRTGP
jgi:hypothetical protein